MHDICMYNYMYCVLCIMFYGLCIDSLWFMYLYHVLCTVYHVLLALCSMYCVLCTTVCNSQYVIWHMQYATWKSVCTCSLRNAVSLNMSLPWGSSIQMYILCIYVYFVYTFWPKRAKGATCNWWGLKTFNPANYHTPAFCVFLPDRS